MSFSIPKQIFPNYSVPTYGTFNSDLKVGSSVKDLAIGTETNMKKNVDEAIARAYEKYDADVKQFQFDYEAAVLQAEKSSENIGDARFKKALAITALAATILLFGGATFVASEHYWHQNYTNIAIATLLVGVLPTGYLTSVFSENVSALQQDIDAPHNMTKPVLNLPVYKQEDDLDLEQTRITAQNIFATMSVNQLARSVSSESLVTSYALFDRITPLAEGKKSSFYAKCFQLMEAVKKINQEHLEYKAMAEHEFKCLQNELTDWKANQDKNVCTQENILLEHELFEYRVNQARARGEQVPTRPFGGLLNNIMNRWQIENLKTETNNNFSRRMAENTNWYQTTINAINNGFNKASLDLEQQFNQAKSQSA